MRSRWAWAAVACAAALLLACGDAGTGAAGDGGVPPGDGATSDGTTDGALPTDGAADGGAATDGATDGAPASEAWVRFAPDAATAEAGEFQDAFPLYEQRDVIAVVAVPDVPEPRVLRLQIIGTSGAPYQTIWRAFASSPQGDATLPHPNTGEPMPIETVSVVDGMAMVYIAIPIAGTNLTRYGLTGVYTVEISLDEGPVVCSGTFELQG